MISVILLTYNGERYVEKAIQSVIYQTIGISNIQLIVVDDCSTDNTINCITKYEKQYPDNILVIKKDVNSGIAKDSSREIGLSYADGEYILFLDQDDRYLPEAFEKLKQKMDEDLSLDYIEYSFNYVNENGEVFRVHRGSHTGYKKYTVESEEKRISLEKEKILPCSTYIWSKIYRKSFLINKQIYHNTDDLYTGYRDNFFAGLLELNVAKFAYYYEPMYEYLVWGGSWSHSDKINDIRLLERLKVAIAFETECNRRGYDKTKRQVAEYIFFRTFCEKTFWRLLYKFEPLPIEIFQFMQKYVLEKHPDYKSNSLLLIRKRLMPLIELLEYEWNPKMLMEVKSKFCVFDESI